MTDFEAIYRHQQDKGISSIPLRLRLVVHAYTRAADEALSQQHAGMSSARFIVLAAAGSNPGASNKTLAELTGQRPQSANDTASALERDGLIERRHGHGRERLHYLTPAGASMLESAYATLRELHERVLTGVDADRIADVADVLDTIRCNLAGE